MPSWIDSDTRGELLDSMKSINRLDLWGQKECRKLWKSVEEPTIEWVIEELLKLYPEKKNVVEVIDDDWRYDDLRD